MRAIETEMLYAIRNRRNWRKSNTEVEVGVKKHLRVSSRQLHLHHQ
ncbi:MAG: hypothetical protein NC311_07715 [Muribaculaceae bacterium]|nr:hypothetical protein [Muribaculaceae bacterium]